MCVFNTNRQNNHGNRHILENNIMGVQSHVVWTGPGGVMVERSLGVRKVAGSIPSCDIPKVVKRWYKQLPCLRSALKGECLEI